MLGVSTEVRPHVAVLIRIQGQMTAASPLATPASIEVNHIEVRLFNLETSPAVPVVRRRE